VDNQTVDIRPFGGLGRANHGWLDAHHHCSFANYHDAERIGGALFACGNDDTIAAQSGFPPPSHNDMES
jgi:redox-sensitive bicupin YhaK (pirin superfamily)